MQRNVSPSSSSSKFQSIFGREEEASMSFTKFDSDSDSSISSAIDGNCLYSSLLVQDRQEMVNRHSLCLHRLRRAADEATSLRHENTSLRSVNVELNRKLRLLIQASVGSRTMFRGEKEAGKKSVRFWEGEKRIENVEVERFLIPKSISVKSEEYLKRARAIVDNGRRARLSTQSRIPTLQNVKVISQFNSLFL